MSTGHVVRALLLITGCFVAAVAAELVAPTVDPPQGEADRADASGPVAREAMIMPPDDAPVSAFAAQQAPSSPATEPGPATPGIWVAQGPGPTLNGQVENVAPGNEVVGAVHTVAAHPEDPDVLWVGGTNGGLWRTNDATAASPTWTPLSDSLPSLSIGALDLDPTDPSHQTLVAGIGRFSSFARLGGDRVGLARSTDGGDTWTLIDGGGTLVGKNVSGVAPRGDVLVLSVNYAEPFTFGQIGIFRSTDGGASFVQVSSSGGAVTGLPGGLSNDLASDPGDPDVLYTNVTFADFVGGVNGIYKSTNAGATWSKVSSAAIDAVIISGTTSNVEISVGPTGVVYVGVINTGQLAGLFRSPDGGLSWTELDLPQTVELGVPIGLQPNPKGPGPGSPPEQIAGGQGAIHFSIRADPFDPQLVHLGGDRQPSPFPNSLGAFDFSGRLFRVDAGLTPGAQAISLTHLPTTASTSAPHADSREIVFDALGEIIEVDDGGIYRRTDPRGYDGDWFSIIGNLQTTEFHDIAYDSLSNVIIGGAQDTGTPQQLAPGSLTWESVSTADGGDVLVDDWSTPGVSTRYSSFQFLFGFRRRTYDADNVAISNVFPGLQVVGGGAINRQFVTPLALNRIDANRLVIGGRDAVYESFDRGDTVYRIGPGIAVNGPLGEDPIVAGGFRNGEPNAELLYVGSFGTVYLRTEPGQTPTPTAAPFPGSYVQDLTIDPNDWARAFAINYPTTVWMTTTAGQQWTNVTGNLSSLSSELRTIEFVTSSSDLVVVGGRGGAFRMLVDNPGVWVELGHGLSNAPVWDLDYDETDDVLVAGTLGRGAWLLTGISCGPEGDEDEDGDCDDFDNCPTVSNQDQLDADGDGLGNACDNCPDTAPADQADGDVDGAGDLCDNCLDTPNEDQADDVHPNGIGDACDDPDEDGVFDLADNCPDDVNPEQQEIDGDGVGNVCDICPSVSNPGQTETLACIEVDQQGGQCLETIIDLVPGNVDGELVLRSPGVPVAVTFEILNTGCLPNNDVYDFFVNGVALGQAPADPEVTCSCTPGVQTVTFDDAPLIASAWNADGVNSLRIRKTGSVVSFAWGRASVETPAQSIPLCIRDVSGGGCVETDLCEVGATTAVDFAASIDEPLAPIDRLTVPFQSSELPGLIEVDELADGAYDVCVLSGEDAECVPIVKQGEIRLGINGTRCVNEPPVSEAGPAIVAECDGDGTALVVLDGTGSSDPDSAPGTADDIVLYRWFESFGSPGQASLGEGAVLPTPLPLGTRDVTLEVTDVFEATDVDDVEVSVVDTTPPVVTLPPMTVVECTAPGGVPAIDPRVQTWLGAAGTTDVCGDASLTNDLGAFLPLGVTVVSFTAEDEQGLTAVSSAGLEVVDSRPPVVGCVVVDITDEIEENEDDQDEDDENDQDEGTFRIEFEATDACQPVTVVAELRAIEGTGGTCGPFPVTDGQIIELECDDECEVEWDDGLLEVEARVLRLVVTATDASGNSATCEIEVCDGQSDDEDEDRLGGRLLSPAF